MQHFRVSVTAYTIGGEYTITCRVWEGDWTGLESEVYQDTYTTRLPPATEGSEVLRAVMLNALREARRKRRR